LQNPWGALPRHQPYVLPEDQRAIEVFNREARHSSRIDTSLLPEPWVGDVAAPLILLAQNPGTSEDDHAQLASAGFRDRVLACHAQATCNYPFYYLHPAAEGPGFRWWSVTLKALLSSCGRERVARGVVAFEYFPYHSVGFDHGHVRLACHEYTFWLLREAMKRDATVIITRGRRLWVGAVPELADYQKCYTTNSVQRASISPKNCPNGFEIACKALTAYELVG